MPTIQQAQAAAVREGFFEPLGVDPASFENARLGTLDAMLKLYAEDVIEAARANLDAEKKQSTGNLQSSFTIRKVGEGKKFAIEILAADYLKFVDQGVQGSDAAKSINNTSPFRYKRDGKMPPISAIQDWIKINRNKISARDVSRYGTVGTERKPFTGKVSDKSLAFLIARSIKQKGLKRTGFWSKAWDATFKDFNQQIAAAVGNDIQITLQTMNKIVNGNNS